MQRRPGEPALSDKTEREGDGGSRQEVTAEHITAEDLSSHSIRHNGQLEPPVRAQRALSIYKTPQTLCVCVCVCLYAFLCVRVCVCCEFACIFVCVFV